MFHFLPITKMLRKSKYILEPTRAGTLRAVCFPTSLRYNRRFFRIRKMPQIAEIRLHNTLSNQTEPFVPQKSGEVTMYTCGPTVYDFGHIGNYRTFVLQQILRRFLNLR